MEDDNPFSFKKFVTTKEKPAPRDVGEESLSENIDDDDIFGISSLKLGSSRTEKSRDETTSGM